MASQLYKLLLAVNNYTELLVIKAIKSLDEQVPVPPPLDQLPIDRVVHSFSVRVVLLEPSLVVLAVGEEERALSVFEIAPEVPVVKGPHFLYIIQVFVVKGLSYDLWILIVEFAMTFELVVGPVAFVSEFSRLIKEFALALHFVEAPLALVHASVLVVKDTETVTHALPLETFVLAALLVTLHHVLALLART